MGQNGQSRTEGFTPLEALTRQAGPQSFFFVCDVRQADIIKPFEFVVLDRVGRNATRTYFYAKQHDSHCVCKNFVLALSLTFIFNFLIGSSLHLALVRSLQLYL
jgi:hypothetical protein